MLNQQNFIVFSTLVMWFDYMDYIAEFLDKLNDIS